MLDESIILHQYNIQHKIKKMDEFEKKYIKYFLLDKKTLLTVVNFNDHVLHDNEQKCDVKESREEKLVSK